jgi:transcriptional regulator with XRE-family HTH domain
MGCFGKPPAELSRRVDEHVGVRIRLRRTLLGLTQDRLAVALNMSYQQIQKYETGTNRVSAGRLFQLAQMLEIDVAFFFDGLDPSLIPQPLPHGGHNRVAIDLVRNFLEINDERSRAAVAHLVKTLKERLSVRMEDPALASDEEPAQVSV